MIYESVHIDENGKRSVSYKNADGTDATLQQWQAGAAQQAKDAHNAPILLQLSALDTAAVRPLRAIQAAIAAGEPPLQSDKDRLTQIETESAALRAQLQG